MNKILLVILAITFAIAAQAQVTIGSDSQSAKAALLELKTQDPSNPPTANDPANVTSEQGGLMLPRVMLTDTATLEPFIATSDPEWIDNSRTKIKETHAGLTVYNLTNNAMFSPGIYSWNGNRWENTWAYPYGANNGLNHINDSIHIGGSLTKDMNFNTNGHAINFAGSGALNINTPVTLTDSFIYSYGQPGDGKIIIADDNGIGSWQNNNALKTTPAAQMSDTGTILKPPNWGDWHGTKSYLTIPPGKWFVMITMHVQVDGADDTDRLWVKSSLIRVGETAVNAKYFDGKNRLISGRAYKGKNIMNGFLVMLNDTSSPIRFEYNVGAVSAFSLKNSANVIIRQLGGKSFPENAIVAFALK